MAFDISALNTAMGAYCRENSQRIFMDAIYKPEDANHPTFWGQVEKVVIKDEYAVGLADFDIEVEEASDSYTSQGDIVTVSGKNHKLRKMDASFDLPVYSLYQSWLQHIYQEARQDNLNTGDVKAGMLSFAAWLFENARDKFIEKFKLLASFQGVYSAGYSYGTGSFGASMDGYNKQVADARTAVEIPAAQVAATGVITSSNAYDSFEAMGKLIPVKNLYKEHLILSSVNNTDNYNIDYRTTHGGNNPRIYDAYKRPRLDDREKVSIIPVPEMGSSGRVFITPVNNMFWFSDFNNHAPQILTAVADPKVIKVTMSYAAAVGFKRIDHLVVNDQ